MNPLPPSSARRFLRHATLAALPVAWLGTANLHALDWPQWRGPQRNGLSAETGLLQEWPKDGPQLVWQIQDCGAGYSTPAIVGDRIYLLGNEGLENEFVRALAAKDGHEIWRTRLGKVGNPGQKPSFPAARSTPTVDGGLLFVLGSDGDLACLDAGQGEIKWQKNLRTEWGGKPGEWAYAESPLIDGDRLICTPGGADATVVALKKQTGELIWKYASAAGDPAAYSSPVVVEVGGVRQYVQAVQKGLLGLAADSGRLLWRYDRAVSKYGANIPSPVFRDGVLYAAGAGTGGAFLRLKAKDGGIEVEELAFSPKLPTAIGGAVIVGDALYGTTAQALICADFGTGTIKWEERAMGAASLCVADGRLYLHGENGEVGLAEVTPAGYRELSRFSPPGLPARSQAMEKAWTYPVVANGRLYIRDLQHLWCYAVK